MKLKQKLAEEFEDGSTLIRVPKEYFLAGFEKAREMAVKEYDTFEYGKQDLRQRIKNLGDEEV